MAGEREDNTQQNDAGGGNEQQDVGQQQESYGKEVDDKLSRLMEDTSRGSQGATTDDTQQQGERDKQGDRSQGSRTQGATGANQQQSRATDDTRTQQDQQTQQIPAAARKFGENFYSDTRGNIYDAKGALMARAGAGHQDFRRMFPYIDSIEKERNTFKQRIEHYEAANQLAKAAGLSLDEQGAAMQLIVQWKKEPLKTLQTLLTQAQNAGIDVSSIQQGGGSFDQQGFNARLEELLDKRFSRFDPILQNFTSQRENEEQWSAVQQEHSAFLEEFPDAANHQTAVANVMRDKGYNAREAWMTIRAFAAETRMDLSKDLAPQIQAWQQRNGRAPNGGGNNRPLPDMSGRNSGGNENSRVETGSREPFSAETSWDKIIEGTLARHGVTRQ